MATRKNGASPRAAQVEAFFAMCEARDEVIRAVEDKIEGIGEISADEISDKCADKLSDLLATHDATRDNVIELSEKGAGKAIDQAFNLDEDQNARDVLRADHADGLRHSFKEDEELRATLRALIREEIREVCVNLRTMIGEEIAGALGLKDALSGPPANIEAVATPATPAQEFTPVDPNAARILHAQSAAVYLRPMLGNLRHEEFWAILLTSRLQPVKAVRISSGGQTACAINAKEAFYPAIREQLPRIMFAHNHPSGDPSPSPEDMRLFLLLDEAGRTLGIPVVDHLILGAEGFNSKVEGFSYWPDSPARDEVL